MTIHFEITPAVIEVACHFAAATCYFILTDIARDSDEFGVPFVVLLAGIVFNTIGAHQ